MQLTEVFLQRIGGSLRCIVILCVSITVVSGMGSLWRSCCWPAFINKLLSKAPGFAALAARSW